MYLFHDLAIKPARFDHYCASFFNRMVTLFQEAVDAASDIDGARVSYIPTLEAVIVISRDKDELLSLGTCNNHRLPHRDVRVGCNILWSSVDNTFFAMAVPHWFIYT